MKECEIAFQVRLNRIIDSEEIIMTVWNQKALFATALIVCVLSVSVLHKHFKCNLASVVDELVRLQFLFLCMVILES